MDIQNLRNRKKSLKLTTAEIAFRAELPVSTVSKIMTGETKNPTYATIEKIERVLRQAEQLRRIVDYYRALSDYIEKLPGSKEAAEFNVIDFNKQYLKEHDIESNFIFPESDLHLSLSSGNLALKADNRITIDMMQKMNCSRWDELFDGEIVNNEAPSVAHQRMVKHISRQIDRYIEDKKGECEVFDGGINVEIEENDYYLFVPDIAVICDKERITERGVSGGPDWVVEVTSPSTSYRDYKEKMYVYLHGGVREYWVVDMEKQRVVVYLDEIPVMAHIYSFDDEIPVGLYGGELKIKL